MVLPKLRGTAVFALPPRMGVFLDKTTSDQDWMLILIDRQTSKLTC